MDLMDLVAHRIKIFSEGTWRKNQVEIKVSDEYLPEISDEMREIAKERFEERKKKNPKHFDGPTAHLNLNHSIIQPDCLSLAIAKSRYSLYDIARKEYAEKFKWETLPTGMGMGIVVLTSDSKIVMHQRFPWVDHTAKIGVIGSIYDGEEPFNSMCEEIREELGIKKEEIINIALIGISHRLDERVNYEFDFLVEVSLTTQQIKEREKTLKQREGEIFFLNQNPEELKRYLKENHERIISSSFSSLTIAGRHWWGPDWSQI